MNDLALLDTAARTMAAQRSILDVAARNVAAAQAAVPGRPYERIVARFLPEAIPDAFDPAEQDDDAPDAPAVAFGREAGSGDALGEMIALLDAQRAYEAGASVFDIGKRLAERTLEIERT